MKPWSLSTTVRNPERILPFLHTLKEMEGEDFDENGQVKFQILLIQNRLYKPNGLGRRMLSYYETSGDKMTYAQAEEIFEHMKSRSNELRKDPGLRGRTSVAPLTKMGLAIASKTSGAVQITDLGRAFLIGEADIGDVYFRFFIKWQIPNPQSKDYANDGSYDIKPFIGVLHLINLVNEKEAALGNKPKGISKKEFALFAPTLVQYNKVNDYAQKIINLRAELKGRKKQEQREIFEKHRKLFASEFLNTKDQKEIEGLLSNLKDYGDNAIRYFRLTRFIHIRGGGFYVDLEPRRSVEIKALLEYDNAQSDDFESKEAYLDYISDVSRPELPWETPDQHREIIANLLEEVERYENKLQKDHRKEKAYSKMGNEELKECIEELRRYRRVLQEEDDHQKSQSVEQIETYIESLENIFDFEDRPILLEKLSALGLHALNDAIKIQPNYPVGDDNEPTFTAPANTPDIECFYENFNAICEVTMLKGRDQWYNEGQPVMRHLRDFEEKHEDRPSYCLFIAPTLHRDTINTFWTAIKYEYEGRPQKIVPLSINHFVSILKILLELKQQKRFLKHEEISHLYDEILNSSTSFSDSSEWLHNIPETISSWKENLISQT